MSSHLTTNEELESAILRTWVVGIQSKPGLPFPIQQVVVVRAYNEKNAKRQAMEKMRKGRYKYRTIGTWDFTSIKCMEDENGAGASGVDNHNS